MSAALLELKAVTAGYGEVVVLREISLSVPEGSVTALIGSNGAGKTTTMRCVAGLLRPQQGTLAWRGDAINSLSASERVELGISLVPEGRMIFPDFTVEENLSIGAFNPRAKPNRTRRLDDMYALFPRLKERRRQHAGTMSGGEQQMLALARGLMAEPKLLLLDEPSLGLAPSIVSQVFGTIETVRGMGVTIIIVEQNVHRTLELADYAYVLENGRIVIQGEAHSCVEDPRIKQAYLGL
jgi:branched-chain amino acid transport system ATP-binding protein